MFINEWFKYGWGPNFEKTYIPVKNPTLSTEIDRQKLFIDFTNNGSVEIKSPLEAATQAVETIIKKYPPPYTLMLSGGVDSQSMLYSWLLSGYKFRTCSVTYNNIYNYHDLKNLIHVSEKFKTKIDFKNIDAFDFFENELKNYAIRYECVSPQICLYMKFSELITEGTVIFSGNFLETAHVGLNYTILGLHRYAVFKNRPLVPFFFLHTPELAYSTKEFFTNNAQNYKKTIFNQYDLKIKTLQESGFPVIPQEKRYSGFEEIKDYYDRNVTVPPKIRLKYSNFVSKRNFDILYRYIFTDKLPYSEDFTVKLL